MIFVRQDFIVFKNGNFFTLDYVLFSYGNCFCGIYRRIFAQCGGGQLHSRTLYVQLKYMFWTSGLSISHLGLKAQSIWYFEPIFNMLHAKYETTFRMFLVGSIA